MDEPSKTCIVTAASPPDKWTIPKIEMEDAVGAEAARVKCCKCFIRPRLSAGLLAVFAPVLSTADGTRELQQAVAGVLQSGIAKHSKHLTN
uniref:Uncharacterized protein n=1 Tax=Oryza glumipatula TaxID=40148 RepID=A0A0D9ZIF5_9ORYZ